MADFKLSAQLVGHEADVRSVCFPSADLILSASRDCSVRLWRRTQDSSDSFQSSIVSRGSDYINSLAFIPPSNEKQDGLVVSGGKDTVIEIKSPNSSSIDPAERLLVGHAHNVCALDVSPLGTYLASGGWDGQARVWNLEKWETEFILEGHNGMAVWSVVALDEDTVITGCADKCIRIFDLRQSSAGEVTAKTTIQTPDVVRALCKVPHNHPTGADIASASNDGILRLWKLSGQQVGKLEGHDSFVYSLTSLPSGELVSSGEDRTIRVWKGLECVQTITHPAISVWTVAANPSTGDIVSGASDGVARVFTRHAHLVADQKTLALFEESVKASAIPQQQVGKINKEELPGPQFLTTKSGTKEGQVQMINEENGSIAAYQWSISQQQWINVGTVVDAVGSTGKKVEYNGSSYDYVFDVDIEDGKPALKLPYNLAENPYDRARTFLGDNELPLSYLENVANFIVESTKGATIGHSPQNADSGHSASQTPSKSPNVLPQVEYLSISAAKYDAMFNKITSINKTMLSLGNKDAALNPGEEAVLQTLREAVEATRPLPAHSLSLVVRIVTHWPYSDRLPGLDLLRCVARYPVAAQYSDDEYGSLLELAISSSAPSGIPPSDSATMMGVRVLANLFGSADGRSLISRQADLAISFLERVVGTTGGELAKNLNRNVAIAVTTSAINFSVLVNKEKLLSPEQRHRLIVLLGTTLQHQEDSEVVYRALVALGTILATSRDEVGALNVSTWIREAANKSSEIRIKSVAEECTRFLVQ